MFDYICSICGVTQEQPENDYHEHHDCPYCGNELERAEHCEICGALVADSKFKYHLCPKCEHKTKLMFKHLLLDELETEGQADLLQDELSDGTVWKELRKWA